MTSKNHNKNKLDKRSNYYYIYGKHPSIAALNNPKRKIIEIYCSKDFFENYSQIISIHNYKIVNNAYLNDLLPKDSAHQGIIIKTKQISTTIEAIDLTTQNMRIAILDQVTDPHNVGAIIRSAAAFGIYTVIITKDNSAEENGVLAKTSCGGLEKINLVCVTNIKATIDLLKKYGFWIIGLDSNSKEYISEKILSGKICMVLGSEGSGMRRLTSENCDLLVKIPIDEAMNSINVSSAASIVFYEAYKTSVK